MLCLERAKAGMLRWVGRLTTEAVTMVVRRLLDDADCREAASRLRQVISQWDTGRIFVEKLVAS